MRLMKTGKTKCKYVCLEGKGRFYRGKKCRCGVSAGDGLCRYGLCFLGGTLGCGFESSVVGFWPFGLIFLMLICEPKG